MRIKTRSGAKVRCESKRRYALTVESTDWDGTRHHNPRGEVLRRSDNLEKLRKEADRRGVWVGKTREDGTQPVSMYFIYDLRTGENVAR